MIKTKNPIPVGSFDSIYDGTKKIHKSTNTWWLKTVTLLVFLLGFSTLDGATLYPVFEYIFASSPLILYATTFGTAVAINFLPCIAARFYLRSKYGLQERNYMLFFVTLGLFVAIFIVLGTLRFATAGEVIGNMSGFMSSSSGTAVDDTSVPGATPMIIVQVITNLVTSAIAFFLSYFSENPLKMRLEAIELQIADFEERAIALACAKKELSLYNYDSLIEREKNKCRLAHEALEARKDALKIESDKQLEMILGSADADTVITDTQKAEDAAAKEKNSDKKDRSSSDDTLQHTIHTTKEVA